MNRHTRSVGVCWVALHQENSHIPHVLKRGILESLERLDCEEEGEGGCQRLLEDPRLSSADQRRRPPAPVITSTRRTGRVGSSIWSTIDTKRS